MKHSKRRRMSERWLVYWLVTTTLGLLWAIMFIGERLLHSLGLVR